MELQHVKLSQTQVNRKKFNDFEKLHFAEALQQAKADLEAADYNPVAVRTYFSSIDSVKLSPPVSKIFSVRKLAKSWEKSSILLLLSTMRH